MRLTRFVSLVRESKPELIRGGRINGNLWRSQRALSPARVPAFLFHGTDLFSLINILKGDSLVSGSFWGEDGEVEGPRLTASDVVGRKFINAGGPGGMFTGGPQWGGVLVLDGKALASQYEMVPFQDSSVGHSWRDEAEIIPDTSGISPLNRYLRQIQINGPEMNAILTDPARQKELDQLRAEAEPSMTLKDVLIGLRRVLKHPLTRSFV